MVLSAGALGLKGICFTEHMDADYPPEYESFEADPSAILKEISRLRPLYDPRFRSINPESGESCGPGRYPDSADVSVEIGFGLELGMQSHLPERYEKLARDWPFDFLTASQHLTLKKDPWITSSAIFRADGTACTILWPSTARSSRRSWNM